MRWLPVDARRAMASGNVDWTVQTRLDCPIIGACPQSQQRGAWPRPLSPLRPALPLHGTSPRLHPPGALPAPARGTRDSPTRSDENQRDMGGLCPALSARLGRRPGRRGRFIGALDMGARRLVRGLAVRQPLEASVHGVPILLDAETYRGASSLWPNILLPPAFAACLSV